MTDGKTYEISNGAPGTAWTIGSDGFWYMNGEKTEYRAIGEPGAAGAPGEPGAPGENGKDGKYYVPNAETGNFDIYQGDENLGDSGISWRSNGSVSGAPEGTKPIYATFDGTKLTIPQEDPNTGEIVYITIPAGSNSTPLTSIAFIPDVYTNGVPEVSFFTLANKTIYVKDGEWAESKETIAASNEAVLAYRVNPAGAFVDPTAGEKSSFISRNVTIQSRAAGDNDGLLKIDSLKAEDGVLNVFAKLNQTVLDGFKLEKSGKTAVVALRLVNGQDTYVSDYASVYSSEVKAALVDSVTTAKNLKDDKVTDKAATAGIYDRTKADPQGDKENISDYIKKVLNGGTATVATLEYTGSLDLKTIPGLFVADEEEFLPNLGFEGVNYKFSLPAKYDIDGTDQQHFVTLNGTILSVPTSIGNPVQADGRTPVVQVDAYIGKDLVATAFMLIQIGKAEVKPDEIPAIDLGTSNLTYSDIKADDKGNYPAVGVLGWEDINSKIYGASGLNSVDFGNTYGKPKVTVTIPLYTDAQGKKVEDKEYTFTGSNGVYTSTDVPGITVNADLTADATTTISPISIIVDNKIHTQEGEIDGHSIAGDAATYTVKIVYSAAGRGDIVITKVITAKETHNAGIYNTNYVKNGVVTTYGKPITDGWSLKFLVTDAFAYDTFKANNVANVKILEDEIELPKDSDKKPMLSYDKLNKVLSVNGAIKNAATLTATVKYSLVLVNGETCKEKYSFKVTFKNPFVAADAKKNLGLNGNQVGAQSVKTAQGILVNDFSGQKILSWEEVKKAIEYALVLSKAATESYCVNGIVNLEDPDSTGDVKITYAPDNSAAYKEFMSGPNGNFKVDEKTGEVTYSYQANLVKSYTFNINATVTFKNSNGEFSQVVCAIPFTVKGAE